MLSERLRPTRQDPPAPDGGPSTTPEPRWVTWAEAGVTAALAGLFFVLGLGGGRDRLANPLGGGDQLPAYATARLWGEGSPFGSSVFGYPFGMQLRDYPTADVLQNTAAGLVTWLTDNPFLGINAVFAVSFPVTALAALWVFRVAGLRGPFAVVGALALTFVPYHWYRIVHVYLGTMYSAVLGVGLALLIGNGTVGRRLRAGAPGRVRFALLLLALAVVIAASGIYYAAFTVLICAAAWVYRLARGAGWADLARAATPVVAVVVVLGLVLTPAVLYGRAHPAIEAVAERATVESVIFSGALVFTLLPAPISRVPGAGWLNRLVEGAAEDGKDWIWSGVVPGQTTVMARWYSDFGSLTTTGALLVVLVGGLLLARRSARLAGSTDTRPMRRPDEPAVSPGLLALLLGVTLLFFVPWGLNYLFAYLVSPQLRGWDRLLPVFFTLLLLAAGLVLQRWGVRLNRLTTVLVAGALLLVLVLDSVLPFRSVFAAVSAQGRESSDPGYAYANVLNEAVPGRCGVLELPYIPYPESGPKVELGNYEPLWPALTNPEKSWSAGAMKATTASAWQAALGDDVDAADVAPLAAGGFCVVHVDRRGYSAADADRVVADLTALLGSPVASGLGGTWLAFELASPAEDVDPSRLAEEPGEIGTFYAPPRFTPGDGAPEAPLVDAFATTWWLPEGDSGLQVTSLAEGPAFRTVDAGLRAGGCDTSVVVTVRSADGEQTRSVELAAGAEQDVSVPLPGPARAAELSVTATVGACAEPATPAPGAVALVDPRAVG